MSAPGVMTRLGPSMAELWNMEVFTKTVFYIFVDIRRPTEIGYSI